MACRQRVNLESLVRAFIVSAFGAGFEVFNKEAVEAQIEHRKRTQKERRS